VPDVFSAIFFAPPDDDPNPKLGFDSSLFFTPPDDDPNPKLKLGFGPSVDTGVFVVVFGAPKQNLEAPAPLNLEEDVGVIKPNGFFTDVPPNNEAAGVDKEPPDSDEELSRPSFVACGARVSHD
jgi:hypothetical protein